MFVSCLGVNKVDPVVVKTEPGKGSGMPAYHMIESLQLLIRLKRVFVSCMYFICTALVHVHVRPFMNTFIHLSYVRVKS